VSSPARLAGGLCLLVGVSCVGEGALPPKARVACNAAAKDVGAREGVAPDLEIVTPHYRGAHAAAKGRSGFQQYRTSGGRIGGRSRGGRGRPFDPHVADDILS